MRVSWIFTADFLVPAHILVCSPASIPLDNLSLLVRPETHLFMHPESFPSQGTMSQGSIDAVLIWIKAALDRTATLLLSHVVCCLWFGPAAAGKGIQQLFCGDGPWQSQHSIAPERGDYQPTLSHMGRVQPLALHATALADTPNGLWPLAELSGLERFFHRLKGFILIKM